MSSIARMIEHTLLRAEATPSQIEGLCEEARRFGFYSVCIQPRFVPMASSLLRGSGVRVSTVAGFPLGATLTSAKAFEARSSVEAGADEVDMVMAVGLARAGMWDEVQADIRAVVEASSGALVKVIIECCYLSDDEKARAVEAAIKAGAHFVKTSTGLGSGGATVHDVELMARACAGRARVKAAGGIRTLELARAMIAAGACLIGTSSGPAIMTELRAETT